MQQQCEISRADTVGSIIIFSEPQFETPVYHYNDKHKDIYGDNRTELGLLLSRTIIIDPYKLKKFKMGETWLNSST